MHKAYSTQKIIKIKFPSSNRSVRAFCFAIEALFSIYFTFVNFFFLIFSEFRFLFGTLIDQFYRLYCKWGAIRMALRIKWTIELSLLNRKEYFDQIRSQKRVNSIIFFLIWLAPSSLAEHVCMLSYFILCNIRFLRNIICILHITGFNLSLARSFCHRQNRMCSCICHSAFSANHFTITINIDR